VELQCVMSLHVVVKMGFTNDDVVSRLSKYLEILR
jgi:hypothetical protein